MACLEPVLISTLTHVAPATPHSPPPSPAVAAGASFVSHPGLLASLLATLAGRSPWEEPIHRLLLLDPAMAFHLLQQIGNRHPGAQLAQLQLDIVLADMDTGAIKQLVTMAAITSLAQQAATGATPGSLARDWRRALATAHLSRELARQNAYAGLDEAWLAGLLAHLPHFVQSSAKSDTWRLHCIAQLERLPLRSFLPDVLRYLDEPTERLRDAAPLVRFVVAAHRLTTPRGESGGDTLAATSDGLFLAQPIDQETINGMLQGTNKAVEAILDQYGASQAGEMASKQMASELKRFGRLEIAAATLRQGAEAAIAALADSLASQDGLFDPIYLRLNKRTSTLEAMPLGGGVAPPISIRVEGSNTAAVRALFTRSCTVVYYDDEDTSILDLQIMHQADADGLAAIPVGEGAQRGVLLICGDQDALEAVAEHADHYARLGEVTAQRPVLPEVADGLEVVKAIEATNPPDGSDEGDRDDSLAVLESITVAAVADVTAVSTMAALPDKTETANGADQPDHDDRSDTLATRVRRAAHEVNNPLGIIKNYLAILKVKLGDDAPISDELRIIYEELDRIVRIMRSLTHEDMGHDEPNTQADVNALITDLVKVTAPTWNAKGLQVLTQLTPGLPRLACDRDKLKQILLNLLLNALEATPQGGTMRLETAAVTNHRQEQFLEITVADSGTGIPPERAAQLFSPVESEKGGIHAGLGLSIVKTLTESLEGVISFKSNISGTTFQISLPMG